MAHRIFFLSSSVLPLFYVALQTLLMVDMFKDQLPPNCPPTTAYERKMQLYRLFHENDLTESYKNYVELYPEHDGYKKQCAAYALSFSDSLDAIKGLLQKDNNVGKKIALVEISESDGKLSPRSPNGHYNFWPYKTFSPLSVKYDFVEV